MNIASTLKVAAKALVRNKARSLLTTLGIVVGIAAVIAMMAVGEGATFMIRDQVGSMGDNLIVIHGGSSRFGGIRGGAGSQNSLTYEDGMTVMNELEYVKAFTPGIRSSAQIMYRENNWGTSIFGSNASYLEVRNWDLTDGDFFNESDIRVSARVCVLGQTTMKNLFNGDDPVGKMIRIKNMPFKVIGVLAPKGSTAWGMDQDDVVVVPWTTARNVLQNSPLKTVDSLMISLYSMDNMEQAKSEIEDLLRQRHRLPDEAENDFNIMDMTEVTDTIAQVSVVMTMLLTVIASISLFVGGIGIMNIMLVSVTERTREIGLRMAVGAKRRDIMLQFLVESITLSGIGGIMGIALGTSAAIILSKTAKWPILISASYIVVALMFSAGVGVFFGFYPAWRASKLNPIEALRHE